MKMFKAWDVKKKKWFDPHNIRIDGHAMTFYHFGYEDGTPLGVDEVKIVLFIGKKDMKGESIYEGSLVRILYTDWPSKSDSSLSIEEYKKSISNIGVVEYSYEECQYQIKFSDKNRFGETEYGSLNHGKHGEIEVVGNVQESPE